MNGFRKKRFGVTDKRYPGWDYAGDGGTPPLMSILNRVSHECLETSFQELSDMMCAMVQICLFHSYGGSSTYCNQMNIPG